MPQNSLTCDFRPCACTCLRKTCVFCCPSFLWLTVVRAIYRSLPSNAVVGESSATTRALQPRMHPPFFAGGRFPPPLLHYIGRIRLPDEHYASLLIFCLAARNGPGGICHRCRCVLIVGLFCARQIVTWLVLRHWTLAFPSYSSIVHVRTSHLLRSAVGPDVFNV